MLEVAARRVAARRALASRSRAQGGSTGWTVCSEGLKVGNCGGDSHIIRAFPGAKSSAFSPSSLARMILPAAHTRRCDAAVEDARSRLGRQVQIRITHRGRGGMSAGLAATPRTSFRADGAPGGKVNWKLAP